MTEEWKDIEGFDGYQISSCGNVFSKKTGRLLTGSINNHGYVRFDLMRNGKRKAMLGHRLVAMAFLDCPDSTYVINHIDGDKTNNNIDNLEWCTNSYNALHAIHVLQRDINRNRRKPVICVETGVQFPSAYAAGLELGISSGRIWRCCAGLRKTCKGLHWKYMDADVA